MSLPQQFLEGLAHEPDDWELRSVFADWCQDHARPELAECLRWMVRRRKRPYRGGAGRGTWFNADTISPGLGDPESDIPAPVFEKLEGGRTVANHTGYPTVRKAEEAFYDAWRKARASGWDPEG